METIKAGNRGYDAEISVVTYCKRKKDNDERSKFRILLVSFQRDKDFNASNTCMLALRFFYS